jgi:dihydroorotase
MRKIIYCRRANSGRSYSPIGTIEIDPTYKVIDGTGKHLLPGIIDGQVHFRDPGLHTKVIYIQKVKLLAGGVTSFIDMPNTVQYFDS